MSIETQEMPEMVLPVKRTIDILFMNTAKI